MFKSNYFKLIMKLNKVKFGKNLNLYGIPVIFKKKGSQLNIGENCTIKSSFLSNLVDNDFHPIEVEARNLDIKEKIGTRKIKIGKDCFIGANSLILKGVEIGDGSVVGAGSVVTGKFPSNVVIAGNPARVIKEL